MRNPILNFIGTIAVTALMPLAANAQATGVFYQDVYGWVINQYENSESSAKPSCAAVLRKDRLSSMRIERFENGYLFGLNGLSRTTNGPNFPLKFWFDDDRSMALSGKGSFVKDAAYPDDDWLSHFMPHASNPSPLQVITGKRSMSFAFMVPGNRTGNDEVTTTFNMFGAAQAMSAIEACYQVVSSSGINTLPVIVPQSTASDCPDDGPRLPGTGICQGRAVNYLYITGGDAPMIRDDCDWRVNETPMPNGDYLLYLASSCGPHLTRLEYGVGDYFAEISIAQSAMSKGQPLGKVITVGLSNEEQPYRNVQLYAQTAMGNKAAAQDCIVVDANSGGGWPSDAVVVDVVPALAALAPKDEPRFACGPFGLDQENTAYWRIFDGYAWFFNLGQDAYLDFDPRSLTVVKAADLPK